ncbi:MAG: hypothetical protein ACREFP_21185 [Acetobacteraceae bacterium]
MSAPDVTPAALGLRKGPRFGYEYPLRTAGSGACPPEDRVGPGAFMEHRARLQSRDSYDDVATMAEIIDDVVRECELAIRDRDETRRRLQQAVARSRTQDRAWGKPFSRRVSIGIEKGPPIRVHKGPSWRGGHWHQDRADDVHLTTSPRNRAVVVR